MCTLAMMKLPVTVLICAFWALKVNHHCQNKDDLCKDDAKKMTAPTNNAESGRQFQIKECFLLMEHPPYSPNLNL
jgi:hypothetical protein